ncbi:MAG: DUF481 domain-containing protein [Gemmatimonadetes bacterium]|nr:DUF481 domain-containing protein [Gemmatimonadota bacterium]
MDNRIRPGFAAALVMVSLATMPAGVARAQAPRDGWSWQGELTGVVTAGNAEAYTFGIGSALAHRHGKNLLKLEAGGLRTESVIVKREAWGSAESYRIVRNENREKTAEAYFARGRYDLAFADRLFVYGGVDWMRNTFAGIASRTVAAAGAGNTWADSRSTRFKTNLAATWTFQQDVVDDPNVANRFAGLRAGWEFWHRLTATTEVESRLVGDMSLDQTDDVRADITNSLAVAINSRLALKPSLQVLWRNLPALKEVPLFTAAGAPLHDTVFAPLQKTDLLFRLALVVKL